MLQFSCQIVVTIVIVVTDDVKVVIKIVASIPIPILVVIVASVSVEGGGAEALPDFSTLIVVVMGVVSPNLSILLIVLIPI